MPITSSNSPNLFQTPSKAFFARSWGKSSEKPAENKQNCVGSNKEANQLAAAESLLDLVNIDVKVLKVTPTQSDPLANATLESVITSVQPETAVKKLNSKKEKNPNNYCRVVTIHGVSPKDISLDHI